jgi:hypothetical protein
MWGRLAQFARSADETSSSYATCSVSDFIQIPVGEREQARTRRKQEAGDETQSCQRRGGFQQPARRSSLLRLGQIRGLQQAEGD